MDLSQLTIVEAVKGLKEKKFSSRELVKAYLQRIQKVDKKVKAFLTVCGKQALEDAEKADKLIKNDPQIFEKKALLGIPLSMKDIYLTKGVQTTAASKVLENYIPQYNATAAEKIFQAGGILLGKTNCDAWAHGSSGENSDFYPTHNPWNLKKVPGGSSSGSAVAVASDECLMATGTDTGGSIRFPASFCNVVGLKPTYGRVSRYGIIAMASSLDSIGHFTKTVEDSALVLKITAGQDKFDATTPAIPVADYLADINKLDKKKISIGLPKEYFGKGIDIEIKEAIKKTVKILEANGFRFKEVSLPYTKYAWAAYYIIQPAEISSNLARYDGIRYGNKRKAFGDEAKRRIMLGTYTLSAGYYKAYYLKAAKVRSLIINDFLRAFNEVDLLLTPVSPFPPFNLGEKVDDPLQMYLSDILTIAVNLAGLPGLAIPCGFTQDNLPIGMQIIGPQFSEGLLFKAGYAYQQITDWHKRRPEL